MTPESLRPTRVATLLAALALLLPLAGSALAAEPSPFEALFAKSLEEKKGLLFYVNGQEIPGIVTRVIDENTIEVRNQQYDRIIIRLDRVDAVGGN